MATNVISASNSRTSQLEDDDMNAVLLVRSDGSIINGIGGGAAYYATAANARVTVQGSVVSNSSAAIYLAASGGTVSVSESGLCGSTAGGIVMLGGGATLRNAGMVYGSETFANSAVDCSGVYLTGDDNNVTNYGSIDGYFGVYSLSEGGTLAVENRGSIDASGGAAILSRSYTTIENTGSIGGYIDCNGALMLNNFGTITGAIYGGTYGNLSVRNDGIITGLINGAANGDVVINGGTIASVALLDGNDSLINRNVVEGDVYLGVDTASSSSDNDTLINIGTIFGKVFAGTGNDTVDTTGGIILGTVFLGDGADSFAGGDGRDIVWGGTGNDDIDLGGGNDAYFAEASDGKDTVDGGDGIDRYDASNTSQAVTIDLGAETSAGTVGNDIIVNFENVTGGGAADTLTGSDGANRIDGGMGADTIDGAAGNDRLIGGTGTDTITGGAGRDLMTGGTVGGSVDSDTFAFAGGSTGATAATRDRITDFTDHGRASGTFNFGADTIDLSAIDANTTVAGDQAFSFNATKGAAFSGAAGSLVWQQYGAFALVLGDTNGDGTADFAIQLNGTHALFASDFVL